ncbi:MAG: hypothetical protein QS721_09115 [Candidatus Endonucleobacter sp. (ex Gigantidas childressi)]|nr:hypothetical protein [Candidatus Endonucleobacter sp. (ex Gigantidas childressi)]
MTADNRSYRRNGTASVNAESKFAASKWYSILCLLFCLALLGAFIYGYWQITVARVMFDQARVELTAVQKAVESITGDVSMAGENLSKSDLAMRSEIKDVNKEIRKLWDLANKRNKRDISDHNDRLGVLEIKMDKLALQTDKMLSSVTTLKNEGDGQGRLFQTLSSEHATLKLELLASREIVQELKAAVKENGRRHVGTEQAVDSFRIQVNRKMLQLESSVREMNKPSESGL